MILNPSEMIEAERQLFESGISPESLMDEVSWYSECDLTILS